MRHFLAWLFGLVLLAPWAAVAFAQDTAGEEVEDLLPPAGEPVVQAGPTPEVYYCPRAAGLILIDGNLSEAAWDDAPWSSDFVDILGAGAPEPRYVTAVKLLWDSEFLFIAAVLEEPRLQSSVAGRDAYIFQQDNDFEVFIDPDGDTHNYFEFGINALNTVYDLLLTRPYRDGGQALFGWNFARIRHAVRLGGSLNDDSDTDEGWLVELAIPWSALAEAAGVAVPPEAGEYWRMNFSRVEWQFDFSFGSYVKRTDPATGAPHREDNWTWSPQGAVNMHMPERWGYVVFTDGGEGAWINPPNLPLELARHSLYTLYHAQRRFREETGGFAWDTQLLAGYLPVSSLAPGGLIPADDWAAASIYLYPGGYSASQLLPSGQAAWIDETGRSWVGPALPGDIPFPAAELAH
jgi:hypothetical protein